MAGFSIKLDTSEIDGFAKALDQIDPSALGEAMVDTVNDAAERQQRAKPVNWTNERIAKEKGPNAFGKWCKWTPRDGDEKRGIDAGEKAASLSVEVLRGQRKNVAFTFTLPGKTDNDGNPLVFQRQPKSARIDALLGPSVFQLFRVAAGKIEDGVYADLRAAVILTAEKELEKVLK